MYMYIYGYIYIYIYIYILYICKVKFHVGCYEQWIGIKLPCGFSKWVVSQYVVPFEE